MARTILPEIEPSFSGFDAFMREVWDGKCEPNEADGIMMHQHPLYEEWHNACHVARALGFQRTAPTTREGEKGYIFTHPNGARVYVQRDGAAIGEAAPVPRFVTFRDRK